MASKTNKSATGGTKSDLKIKKAALKNINKDIKNKLKENIQETKTENIKSSVKKTSVNKSVVKKAVKKEAKKEKEIVSKKSSIKIDADVFVNKKENKKIIQVIRDQSITSNNNNNNNSEDNENMNNLKLKEEVKSDILIKTDVKINNHNESTIDPQSIQIQDPGFLGNDDVFDETDHAQWQQLREQADIHHRAMQLNKPETHPDFNGVECVECGDVIPVSRLKMHKVRCVDCQTDLEQEKLRNSRNYNYNNKNTPTDWGD